MVTPLSTALVITQQDKNPEPGRSYLISMNKFEWVFQLQKPERGSKKGIGFLQHLQQLWSYRDEIETRNQEEIPFSLRIRGLAVAEAL